MSRRGLHGLSWILPLLWSVSCSSGTLPLTQIVVVVDSDLRVPSELDALSIEVTGIMTLPKATADLKHGSLPRTLGLVNSGTKLGPVTVTVEGLLGGMTIVQRVATVNFKQDQTLLLRMPLVRACTTAVKTSCGSGMTCDAGSCVTSVIDKLPVWNGQVKPFVSNVAGAGAGSGVAGTGAAARGGAESAGNTAGAEAAGSGATSGIPGTSGNMSTAGTAGMGTNQTPSCTISKPLTGEVYWQGDSVMLNGACTDPETGALTTGIHWQSDLDGLLGTTAKLTRANLKVGTHSLSLCAVDPSDSSLMSCEMVSITVMALPPLSVTITSIKQGSNTTSPFATNPSITAMGSGAGLDPITLAWTDSVSGSLGTASTAMLTSPQVGKHTLTLTVTDAHMRTASDTRTFTVLEPGKTQLIAAYTTVNSAIGTRVDVVSAASITIYAAASPGVLYRFDPTEAPNIAAPTLVATTAPSLVHDLTLHSGAGLAYLALSTGFQSCKYAPSTGIDASMCTTYQDKLPSTDTRAILRLAAGSGGMDYLLVGTTKGLFVAKKTDDPVDGKVFMNNLAVSAFAADASTLWIAGSSSGVGVGGLYSYDLTTTPSFSTEPTSHRADFNAPSLIYSDVALGTGGVVWLAGAIGGPGSGSIGGLGRYVPTTATWTTWRAATSAGGATSLASTDVRKVAVARAVDIGGVTRDVVWIATAAGVSRFDPSIPSFTTFTTDDGLPSNDVAAVTVLTNGYKVFGTAAGLAVYKGL